METDFQRLPDNMFKYYLACAFLVFLFIGFIQLAILPINQYTALVFIAALALLSATVIVAMATPKFCECLKQFSNIITENHRIRIVLAVSTTLLVYFVAFIQIVSSCEHSFLLHIVFSPMVSFFLLFFESDKGVQGL